MYKAIHGLTSMYMTDNIVMAGETHNRDTRLSDSNDVDIPPHNSDVLKRSFIDNGSVIWNNLPENVVSKMSVISLRSPYAIIVSNPCYLEYTKDVINEQWLCTGISLYLLYVMHIHENPIKLTQTYNSIHIWKFASRIEYLQASFIKYTFYSRSQRPIPTYSPYYSISSDWLS